MKTCISIMAIVVYGVGHWLKCFGFFQQAEKKPTLLCKHMGQIHVRTVTVCLNCKICIHPILTLH